MAETEIYIPKPGELCKTFKVFDAFPNVDTFDCLVPLTIKENSPILITEVRYYNEIDVYDVRFLYNGSICSASIKRSQQFDMSLESFVFPWEKLQ